MERYLRGWLWAGAAVLAALLVYGTTHQNAPEGLPVLVARSSIQKGIPGNVVRSKHLYQVALIARGSIEVGAITDPRALTDAVARTHIYPGQQLTIAQFDASTR